MTDEVEDLAVYLMYNDEEPPARAVKVLGGMKITGSHLHKINLGDRVVEVPSVTYVKLLEDQIRELRMQFNKLQKQVNRNMHIDSNQNNRISSIEQLQKKKFVK